MTLLVYTQFELDIKQDEIRKAVLIKQETDFAPFCSFLVFWSNSQRGRLLDRGRLQGRGVYFKSVEGAFIR